jgi:hypothetical protein
MDAFLETTTAMLDDPHKTSGAELNELYSSLCSAMVKSYNVFGEHAFRKWPRDSRGRHPINRPLFESWSYVLSKYSDEDLERRKDAIVLAARDLMTDDRAYNDAITAGTGSIAKVRLRFARAEDAARAGL